MLPSSIWNALSLGLSFSSEPEGGGGDKVGAGGSSTSTQNDPAVKSGRRFFISHVQADSAVYALDLAVDLGRDDCWLDVKQPDRSFTAMKAGVEQCNVFVAILSDGYFKSNSCLMEMGWALSKPGDPIVLCFLSTVNVGNVLNQAPGEMAFLAQIDCIKLDRTDPDMFAVGVQRVLRRAKLIEDGKAALLDRTFRISSTSTPSVSSVSSVPPPPVSSATMPASPSSNTTMCPVTPNVVAVAATTTTTLSPPHDEESACDDKLILTPRRDNSTSKCEAPHRKRFPNASASSRYLVYVTPIGDLSSLRCVEAGSILKLRRKISIDDLTTTTTTTTATTQHQGDDDDDEDDKDDDDDDTGSSSSRFKGRSSSRVLKPCFQGKPDIETYLQALLKAERERIMRHCSPSISLTIEYPYIPGEPIEPEEEYLCDENFTFDYGELVAIRRSSGDVHYAWIVSASNGKHLLQWSAGDVSGWLQQVESLKKLIEPLSGIDGMMLYQLCSKPMEEALQALQELHVPKIFCEKLVTSVRDLMIPLHVLPTTPVPREVEEHLIRRFTSRGMCRSEDCTKKYPEQRKRSLEMFRRLGQVHFNGSDLLESYILKRLETLDAKVAKKQKK